MTIGDIDGDGLADVATSTSGMLLNDGSGLGPEQLLDDGVVDLQVSGDANVLHDADAPVAGSGFWYLVRPGCVGASWTSAGPSELPGRDPALP